MILSTNKDLRLLETGFLNAVCRPTVNYSQSPLFRTVFATYSVGLYDKHISDRRQSKTLMLSMIVDPRSLEIERLTAVCRPTGDKWQSKTLFPAICDPRSLIDKSVFDCRLYDMIKERIYAN